MRHFIKYCHRIKNGEKIPRKAKKNILGIRHSNNRLKKRIAEVRITGKLKTIYDGFCISDPFCPKCGCMGYSRSGNRACHPELWESLYCLRCGYEVAKTDNSPYYHVLYGMVYEREAEASEDCCFFND